jgi:hypothetical protein
MVSFILFFSVNLLFCLNVRTVLSVSGMVGQEYNGYGGGKARCVPGCLAVRFFVQNTDRIFSININPVCYMFFS